MSRHNRPLQEGVNHRSFSTERMEVVFTPHLPEELWRQILLEASSINDVSEFSNDPRYHIKLECSLNSATSVVRREVLRSAVRWRARLVLVCHEWAKSAIPILLSHIYPSIPQLPYILKMLIKYPERQPYVQRITINTNVLDLAWELQQDKQYRDLAELIPKITDICPRLITLDTPLLSKGFIDLPQSVKHLRLTVLPSSMDQFLVDPFRGLLRNVTSLTLNLGQGGTSNLKCLALELPKLQVLCLAYTLNLSWATRLLSMWSLPSLSLLSMFHGEASTVLQIVRRFPSLRHLQLARMEGAEWNDTFTMKRLNRIDVIWNLGTIQLLTRVGIKAIPNLHTIGVYWNYFAETPRAYAAKRRFCDDGSSILRALHGWCPPSTKIVLSGSGEFFYWILEQSDVLATIRRLTGEGREIESARAT